MGSSSDEEEDDGSHSQIPPGLQSPDVEQCLSSKQPWPSKHCNHIDVGISGGAEGLSNWLVTQLPRAGLGQTFKETDLRLISIHLLQQQRETLT